MRRILVYGVTGSGKSTLARRVGRRTPTCNGNVETWRGAFLSSDSILRWHFGSFKRKRDRMRRWPASTDFPETVLLRSPAEVERWFASLPVLGIAPPQ
jgi:MoxR-like ATPase